MTLIYGLIPPMVARNSVKKWTFGTCKLIWKQLELGESHSTYLSMWDDEIRRAWRAHGTFSSDVPAICVSLIISTDTCFVLTGLIYFSHMFLLVYSLQTKQTNMFWICTYQIDLQLDLNHLTKWTHQMKILIFWYLSTCWFSFSPFYFSFFYFQFPSALFALNFRLKI